MATAKTKDLKAAKPSLASTWKEIARKQKPLMIAMIVLLVVSAILLVFSLTTLGNAEYGGDCGIRGCLWGDCGDFWGISAG